MMHSAELATKSCLEQEHLKSVMLQPVPPMVPDKQVSYSLVDQYSS